MNIYRPQTKFAKVTFSQVFICPQGEWAGGGSLSGGISVQEGLCPGGVSVRESLSRGVSVWGVSVSVQGDLCPGGSLSRGVSVRETPCMVTSGWYASYWNAFLFVKYFHEFEMCEKETRVMTLFLKHKLGPVLYIKVPSSV